MTTIKADSGREEENNNRMTFCGGYGGQNANNISSGSPGGDSMGPRETIDCGRPLPKDNDLYASVIGSDNKFNDNESNPILANRPNDINGITNRSLAGSSYKKASMSKDGSSQSIDADRPINSNSITAMTSSDPSTIRDSQDDESVGSTRNDQGCFGGQTYAYLTISGTPDSPIPTFTDGGCGCWVSTNADLTLIAGAIGGLSALIQKIPFFNKARVLGRWNTKMSEILTKINLGGTENTKKAYELMMKHKNDLLSGKSTKAIKAAIEKQLHNGMKNVGGGVTYIQRTVRMPDGSQQVRSILPSHKGGGIITIVVPKKGKAGGFDYIRTTPEQVYAAEAEKRYKMFRTRAKKYFEDMEDIKAIEGSGSELAAKMQTNIEFLLQEYAGCFLGTVIGTATVALEAVTVWRAKVCLGEGMSLNENCECVCREGWETACGNVSSSVWSNYADGVATYFGGIAGSIIFAGDEIQHCSLGCCSGQTQITHEDGTCDCQDPDAPSVFIQGNIYSTTGCDCRKKVSSSITGIPPATIPGIYMDGDVKTQMENVGKVFNFDKCVFECPVGSDVREGRTMPALARLEDNLSDPSVPTKEHYLYQTGCNYVCDGRDRAEGTPWPPTCDTGSTFDASKNFCACRPNDGFCCGICTKADSPSEGASCDGCTGCCIYDPASGVAGWDGYYCLTYTVTGSPTGDDCYGCEFGGTPDSEGDCQYLASEIGDC
jgi:hypothetical protein